MAVAPVVLVGYNARVLDSLATTGRYRVVIVEEPDVSAAKDVRVKAAAHGCVVDVVEAPYQQSNAILGLVDIRLHRPVAVVPGQEYAVAAAAALAAQWNLLGAGPAAAATLRDKILLRTATARAGMVAPPWREVKRAEDVAEFMRVHGPAVLKPANRQASVGVHLLDPGDDIHAAWDACTAADEPTQLARRPMRWRYLVEQRLWGDEVSVEALVRGGEMIFINVTGKHLLAGPHPVELGHDVPAALPGDAVDALAVATRQLVTAIGFRSGILHAEYKLCPQVDGRLSPTLIECAGRTPGDMILRLVEHAYGFDPYVALVDLLADLPIDLPRVPGRGAAIRFLAGPTGRLAGVDGIDTARQMPGVLAVKALAAPGRVIHSVTSSWDRVAYAIAGGEQQLEAALRAQAAVRVLHARTDAIDDAVTDVSQHSSA